MDNLQKFAALPALMDEEGVLKVYDEDSCALEYVATLSFYDEDWHIDWTSDEGDSIQSFYDEDIIKVINDAYDWCVAEGFI